MRERARDERGCLGVSGSGAKRKKKQQRVKRRRRRGRRLEGKREKEGLKVKTRVRHVQHLGLAAIWGVRVRLNEL